jgi:hypothetical protein
VGDSYLNIAVNKLKSAVRVGLDRVTYIAVKTENQFKSKKLRSIGVRASIPVTTHRPRHLPSHDLEDRVSRRDQQYVSYKDCCEIFPCSLFLASEKT